MLTDNHHSTSSWILFQPCFNPIPGLFPERLRYSPAAACAEGLFERLLATGTTWEVTDL